MGEYDTVDSNKAMRHNFRISPPLLHRVNGCASIVRGNRDQLQPHGLKFDARQPGAPFRSRTRYFMRVGLFCVWAERAIAADQLK